LDWKLKAAFPKSLFDQRFHRLVTIDWAAIAAAAAEQ
jgi:hypothetical protein